MVAAAGHRRAREERLGFWDGRRERDEEAASRRRVGELGFGVEWTASNSSPPTTSGPGWPTTNWLGPTAVGFCWYRAATGLVT